MNIETIRRYCLSFPYATEDIQWGDDLLFRVGGKIFVAMNLELSASGFLSFKCSPEIFAELVERPGIVPAPYVGRYCWVSLERPGVVDWTELTALIRDSYQMVRDKLPRSIQKKLQTKPAKTPHRNTIR